MTVDRMKELLHAIWHGKMPSKHKDKFVGSNVIELNVGKQKVLFRVEEPKAANGR